MCRDVEVHLRGNDGRLGFLHFRIAEAMGGLGLFQSETRVLLDQTCDRFTLLHELVFDHQEFLDDAGGQGRHANRRRPWLDPTGGIEQRRSFRLQFRMADAGPAPL